MSEKNSAWKEITSPAGGDAYEFFLGKKRFVVAKTLKEKNCFGETMRLCRVFEGNNHDEKFAVLSSFMRVDAGSCTKAQALLRGIMDDEEEAIAEFYRAYDG